MRRQISIRDVQPADLASLAKLTLSGRTESGVGSQLCSDDEALLVEQFGTLASLPGARILVTDDETINGFLILRVIEPNPFNPVVSVFIEALYVAPSQRRRGIGHSLLSEVAQIASQAGADHVYSVQIPGARGVHRFLSRLGFAPVAGHRSVPTQVLLRRLSGDQPETGGIRRRSIEDLIAKRRRSRDEAAQPLPHGS